MKLQEPNIMRENVKPATNPEKKKLTHAKVSVCPTKYCKNNEDLPFVNVSSVTL